MNALMREWERFTPTERFTRWAVYFALVDLTAAIPVALRSVTRLVVRFLLTYPLPQKAPAHH